MSVFESIRNAIFGRSASAASMPAPAATAPPQPAATPATAFAQPAAQPSAPPSVQQPVDVEAILSGLAAKNPQRLNWQQSIVDLMKLLGLDSSLQNRTALAKELGYTGDTADSAAMNIWLQKQVMAKLAESGGKVPQSLRG
jgi:3-oxoacyl-ACP reductase-like protein